MANLPHLANDPDDQKHQVFNGVTTHFDGREDGVGGKLNRRVTLPPGHLNGNKLLAVFLVARLPVLLLTIYAAVLGNLALLALLQDGLIRLHPIVRPAVGTIVCPVDRRGNAGRHLQAQDLRKERPEVQCVKLWQPKFVCQTLGCLGCHLSLSAWVGHLALSATRLWLPPLLSG